MRLFYAARRVRRGKIELHYVFTRIIAVIGNGYGNCNFIFSRKNGIIAYAAIFDSPTEIRIRFAVSERINNVILIPFFTVCKTAGS